MSIIKTYFNKKNKVKEIMERTGCTKEQAEYLYDEIEKLPRIKNTIYELLDNVNLYCCDKVEFVRWFGYWDDFGCNILAKTRDPRFKRVEIFNTRKYCISKETHRVTVEYI